MESRTDKICSLIDDIVLGSDTPDIAARLEEADVRNAEALVLRLNTPGGSVDITKRIIQTMIASDVPVVVREVDDQSAMAMALIPRAGVEAIAAGNERIPVGPYDPAAASDCMNTSYIIEEQEITLRNGRFEKAAAPGSAT